MVCLFTFQNDINDINNAVYVALLSQFQETLGRELVGRYNSSCLKEIFVDVI